MALALFFAIHLAGAQDTTRAAADTTAYPPEGCPAGWINSLEGCFLFHYTKNLAWREAQEECERLGGFLAEIKSEEQAVMLTSLAFVEESLTGLHSWWIGLTDQGHEGRWMWQHSATDPHYTNWAPNSPDNTMNEHDCARMDGSDAFKWSDVECGGLLASAVCQRETNGTEWTTTTDTWETTTTDTWETTTTTAYETHVELRGGDGYSYGNVFAVNSNGFMGPVCDDWWYNKGDKYAGIVCRQLGFSDGKAFIRSHWGSVPNDFAMDDVICNGNETTIQQCTYSTQDDCGFDEGAGVECY
eukprot:GFUD01068188.1.p1 GENE.GFUD01068188.1~~GFUD01068188.1.p1  ORF type:complete len:310 (+),score=76.33 GFUD01068188.1:33-932(+)